MAQKMKIRKSALKRFKLTKSGKLLHRGHGTRHLKSKKTAKRLRFLKKMRSLRGRRSKAKIKKMLGK